MFLTEEQISAVTGLVHYLNEKFDGHGIKADVSLTGLEAEGAIKEPDKGRIEASDTVIMNDASLGVTYAWRAEL